jgi:hypothetical protein
VLGPPRLVAEVPAALAAAGEFFAGAGWRRETELTDHERPAASRQPPAEIFASLGVAELDALGLLPDRPDLPWERQAESLRAAGEALQGLAVVGGEEWAAWSLFRAAPAGAEVAGAEVAAARVAGVHVLAVGWAAGQDPRPLLGLLFDGIQARHPGPLRLAALLPGELPEALLDALGFAPRATIHRYAAEVSAA